MSFLKLFHKCGQICKINTYHESGDLSHYLQNVDSDEYVNPVKNIHISFFKQHVANALCCHLSKEVMYVKHCSLQVRTSHSHETNDTTILYRRGSRMLHILRMMNHGGEECSIHHIMLSPKYPLLTLFR